MLFHMAAVDIRAFDSWEVLKKTLHRKAPQGTSCLFAQIYINPINMPPLTPCGEFNGADGCRVISQKNLMPRDKILESFMCRHNSIFMHFQKPRFRGSAAHLFFSFAREKIRISVSCMLNFLNLIKPISRIFLTPPFILDLMRRAGLFNFVNKTVWKGTARWKGVKNTYICNLVRLLSAVYFWQIDARLIKIGGKNQYTPKNTPNITLCNLFNHVSV